MDNKERKDGFELNDLLVSYAKSRSLFWAFKEFLPKLMDDLTQREMDVINLRFGLNDSNCTGRTLEEVGKIIGSSRARILEVEREALGKMRKHRKLKWKRYENDIKYITDS